MDGDSAPLPYDDGDRFVPLWASPGGPPTTRRGTPVDLDAEELPADTVAELADSTVHLSSPVDLSPEALETLRRELPRPACFERSGWLSGCYALLLPGGSREFPRFTVAHHPVRGVEIHEEEGM